MYVFLVNALKVRWKSLRDAYVKERKYDISRSCGLKVKAKKPWRLKKQMEFLAPFIQNRKDLIIDASNAENSNNNDDINTVHEVDSLNSNRRNSSKIDEEPDSSVTPGSVPNSSKRELVPQGKNVTEIESFFRGISDAVLGLNKKNQILVQREIATLVMNFKLKELEDEEKHNSNS